MKRKNKYILLFSLILLFIANIILSVFLFNKFNALQISLNLEKDKLESLEDNLPDNIKDEMKKIALSSSTLETREDIVKLNAQENQKFKEDSVQNSPDGSKKAYYQNKSVQDLSEMDDSDYTSLIIDKNGKSEVVFQGNFRLSHFEWLNNEEIRVYQGCGSSCLISYVVNVFNKKYTKEVISFQPSE